jgi:hypothetical protein
MCKEELKTFARGLVREQNPFFSFLRLSSSSLAIPCTALWEESNQNSEVIALTIVTILEAAALRRNSWKHLRSR